MDTTIEEDRAEGVLSCAASRPRALHNPPTRLPAGGDLMEPAQRDRLLTVQWNNRLSIGLGLPALVYVAIALTADALSDGAAFVWLVLIGVVY